MIKNVLSLNNFTAVSYPAYSKLLLPSSGPNSKLTPDCIQQLVKLGILNQSKQSVDQHSIILHQTDEPEPPKLA